MNQNLQSMYIERLFFFFFFRFDTKGKSNQRKNKVGKQHTKKNLLSKGNHPQNQKVTYAVGENIYKSHI